MRLINMQYAFNLLTISLRNVDIFALCTFQFAVFNPTYVKDSVCVFLYIFYLTIDRDIFIILNKIYVIMYITHMYK